MIGGKDKKNRFLNLKCFSLNKFCWKSYFVETNNVLNRYGCACLTFQESILVFGGALSLSGQSIGQVISVEMNSFGFKSSVISYSERISFTGLTANVFGKKMDQIIIFGGRNNSNKYSNDLIKFMPSKDLSSSEERFKSVDVVGELPSARFYHSACVCGSNNQFLVVMGGKNENNISYDDAIWIIDLSKIDDCNQEAKPAEDPKAKKPPPPVTRTYLNYIMILEKKYIYIYFFKIKCIDFRQKEKVPKLKLI